MELKDFIAQTTSQIMEGVKEAQKLAEESGGAVNPKGQLYLVPDAAPFMDKSTTRIGDFINFDVAIEVTETTGESGGAKISVSAIGGFGGDLNRKSQNKSISRVNFRLPIIYPKGNYEEDKPVTFPLHNSTGPDRSSGIDSSASITATPVTVQKPLPTEGEEG